LYCKSKEEQSQAVERRRIRREKDEKRQNMLNVETRKIVIDNTITTTKIVEENGEYARFSNTLTSIPSSNNSSSSTSSNTDGDGSSITSTTSTDIITTHHEDCPVCLEKFQSNDQFSWSKTLKCQHIFHSDCLHPWLMKHDDCPCCRTPLFDENDFDNIVDSSPNSVNSSSLNTSCDEERGEGDDDNYGSAIQVRIVLVNGLVSITGISPTQQEQIQGDVEQGLRGRSQSSKEQEGEEKEQEEDHEERRRSSLFHLSTVESDIFNDDNGLILTETSTHNPHCIENLLYRNND
jgi:hypothetical protein